MNKRLTILLSILTLCLMAFTLFSCGSGGGGGGGGSADNSASGETGSIAVLITDAPTDDYLEINITIKKIELLSDEGHVTIFSEDNPADYLRIDLLDLRNETSLLSIEENIPAIAYNKIRLTLDEAVLIDNNHVPHQLNVKTGNDKLDLNPKGKFFVKPGEMLTLYLDIDLSKDDKAIHVIETGTGEYKLRPEVFVEILDVDEMMKIMRFTGIVSNKGDNTFRLCSLGSESDKSDDSSYSVSYMEKDMCILVHVTGGTSFFQEADGEPVSFLELKNEDKVTVIGFFKVLSSLTVTDEHADIGFDAVVVEIGYFTRLKGTITSGVPIGGNHFVFEIAQGQTYEVGFEMTVDVQDKTKIYTWDGDKISESGIDFIVKDRPVEIDGILVKQGTDVVLNSAFILIDIPQSDPI